MVEVNLGLDGLSHLRVEPTGVLGLEVQLQYYISWSCTECISRVMSSSMYCFLLLVPEFIHSFTPTKA